MPETNIHFSSFPMVDRSMIKRRVHYREPIEDGLGDDQDDMEQPGSYEPYTVEDYEQDMEDYDEQLPPPRGRVVYEMAPRQRGGVPTKKRKHNIKSQKSLEEWNQFAKVRRQQLKLSHPNLNYTDVQKKIGEEWKGMKNKLTEEQKSVKDWETLVKWVSG